MEITPPPLLSAVVERLVPPGCREHVLGDLHERLQTAEPSRAASRYASDAATILPCVLWSQLRRLVATRSFRLQALVVYAAFVSSALYPPTVSSLTFLIADGGWLLAAGPALVTLAILAVADIYGAQRQRSPWEHLALVGVALGMAATINLVVASVASPWAVPLAVTKRAIMTCLTVLPGARCVLSEPDPGRAAAELMPLTVDGMQAKIRSFEQALGRRNRVGHIVSSLIIAAFSYFSVIALNEVQRAGSLLIVAAAVYLIYQLRQNRPAAVPADWTYDAYVDFYQSELARQRRFHGGATFWARMFALVPGPLMFFVGVALARPEAMRAVSLDAVRFLMLAALAVPLNLGLARRYRRQMLALDSQCRPNE